MPDASGSRRDTAHFVNAIKHPLRLALTHPCILEEVVDRRTLGQKRPLCSMGHYNNLHDRTRTVAWGKYYD